MYKKALIMREKLLADHEDSGHILHLDLLTTNFILLIANLSL